MKKIKKTTVFFICLISFFILFQSSEKAHATIEIPGYIVLLATDIEGAPIQGVVVRFSAPYTSTLTLTSMANGCDMTYGTCHTTYSVTCLSHTNVSHPSSIYVRGGFQVELLHIIII